jgi:hypothetical protein
MPCGEPSFTAPRTRRWDTLLLLISIICGAVATLLAGGTVIGGSRALDAVGGWRILCSIVAVFTASGTVAGALHKSFQITTRLSDAEKCAAGLRALDAAIAASDLPTETHWRHSSVSQKSMLLVWFDDGLAMLTSCSR